VIHDPDINGLIRFSLKNDLVKACELHFSAEVTACVGIAQIAGVRGLAGDVDSRAGKACAGNGAYAEKKDVFRPPRVGINRDFPEEDLHVEAPSAHPFAGIGFRDIFNENFTVR
jgi:hypothetical protein